jgi:hypothetical protein
VVRAAAPAVVNIYAQKQQRRSAADPFSSDRLFRFFFPEFGGGPVPNDVPENSLGSGVIVDAQGLIVTNHHVHRGCRRDHGRAVGPGSRSKPSGPSAPAPRRPDPHRRRGADRDCGAAKTILRERSLPWRLEVERAG